MKAFRRRFYARVGDIYNKGVLEGKFALYFHHPSTSDASLAPLGHSSFYALVPVPHLGDAPLDWAIEGPRLAKRIIAEIEKRLVPDFGATIAAEFPSPQRLESRIARLRSDGFPGLNRETVRADRFRVALSIVTSDLLLPGEGSLNADGVFLPGHPNHTTFRCTSASSCPHCKHRNSRPVDSRRSHSRRHA